MSPARDATSGATYPSDEPSSAVPPADAIVDDLASPAAGDQELVLARRRDAVDLLLLMFDRADDIMPAFLLLALGAGVDYLGAICVTTALLRRSVAAQAFFVNILADMTWPGYSILGMIGAGTALCSIAQLVFWPRGYIWRWMARRLGRPLAWALALFWNTIVFVEAFLVGWGFELWARPWYIQAREALGFGPIPGRPDCAQRVAHARNCHPPRVVPSLWVCAPGSYLARSNC